MEEAQTPKNKEKIVELTSNSGHKFSTIFSNNKSSSLHIKSVYDNSTVKMFFEADFPLEKIKENKAFAFHESIDEILAELFPLIDEEKVHLTEDENRTYIKINFDLPFKKFKNIEFKIDSKKKSETEIIT